MLITSVGFFSTNPFHWIYAGSWDTDHCSVWTQGYVSWLLVGVKHLSAEEYTRSNIPLHALYPGHWWNTIHEPITLALSLFLSLGDSSSVFRCIFYYRHIFMQVCEFLLSVCGFIFFFSVCHVARMYILFFVMFYIVASLFSCFMCDFTHSWLGSFNSVLKVKGHVNTAFTSPHWLAQNQELFRLSNYFMNNKRMSCKSLNCVSEAKLVLCTCFLSLI